jgi:hypothetical protein
MIKTKTNKNIILFFSILNSIEIKPNYHPLGEKLLDSIEYTNLPPFKEFKELFKNKQIPIHSYQYCVYAINSKLNLDAKNIKPKSGFGEKTYNTYTEKIKPLSKNLYEQSNFKRIYEEEIQNKYRKLSKQLQEHFSGKVEEAIKKTWNIQNPYTFILIPNFLEISHSFGLFRDDTLYSITAPNLTKKGVQFQSQLMISNAIHEFSHSIFQKYLIDNDLYTEHKKLTNDIEIPNSLKSIHRTPHIFMEETLVRVVTILIQEDYYKDALSNDIIKQKSNEMLDGLVKKGYYNAHEMYKKLHKSKNIIESYLNSLRN